MFERLEQRAARRAAAAARERREEIAEAIAAEVPRGVHVERIDEGVTLSGRGVRRRLALEPALRRAIGRIK